MLHTNAHLDAIHAKLINMQERHRLTNPDDSYTFNQFKNLIQEVIYCRNMMKLELEAEKHTAAMQSLHNLKNTLAI
jgi:hypothetical protein